MPPPLKNYARFLSKSKLMKSPNMGAVVGNFELKCFLMKRCDHRIYDLPIFSENMLSYNHNSSQKWVMQQFMKTSPITTQELYEFYLKDKEASSRGLFSSEFNRHKRLEEQRSSPAAQSRDC